MTILFLLCQYGVRSVDWCWGGITKRDQKNDGVCILSQGTVNRVWTVFCIFIPWWLFVSSMVYIMTAGCISQKTEVTAQVSSLTVVVLLCAPHNLSGHTACQLTPWGDRMWVREPSDAAELLTYCRCLLAHITVWMMLGGPQVYSFYTTATIALVKLCLYVTNWQRDNVTWHTTKYGDPFSEFVLCKIAYTQQWTHKHRKHTPGAVGSHLCCGTRGAVGGSVPCSRAPQSWYWGWRERCTFTPPTYNHLCKHIVMWGGNRCNIV